MTDDRLRMFLEEDLCLYSNNDPLSMSVPGQSTGLPAEGSMTGSDHVPTTCGLMSFL